MIDDWEYSEMMKRVDLMLLIGRTPEWISMRGDFTDLPLEIQTASINMLHWRQSYLRQKAAERIFKR